MRVSPASGETREGRRSGFTVLISDGGRTGGDAANLVGAALAAGDDLATHAERAGISVNIAKYHLRMAFAATGARRQIDLVRLAVGLVRDLG